MEFALVCNVIECSKKLVKNAYVTTCSHIFCKDHGQVGKNERPGYCCVCNSKFETALDCVWTDLEPCDRYKTIILSGMNPEQCLDIAGRAISFFTYQMSFQSEVKEKVIKTLKKQHEENSSMYKTEIFKLQRFAEGLKKECDEKIRGIEYQKQKIIQLSRENKSLQAKVERFKQIKRPANMEEQTPFQTPTSTYSPYSSREDLDFMPKTLQNNRGFYFK